MKLYRNFLNAKSAQNVMQIEWKIKKKMGVREHHFYVFFKRSLLAFGFWLWLHSNIYKNFSRVSRKWVPWESAINTIKMEALDTNFKSKNDDDFAELEWNKLCTIHFCWQLRWRWRCLTYHVLFKFFVVVVVVYYHAMVTPRIVDGEGVAQGPNLHTHTQTNTHLT